MDKLYLHFLISFVGRLPGRSYCGKTELEATAADDEDDEDDSRISSSSSNSEVD